MKVIRSTHRAAAAGAMLITASLLLAACANGGSGKPNEGGGAADPDAAMVFGITADVTQTLPWTTTSEQSFQVLSQIYSPLLSTDKDSVIIGNLADLPEISDDNLTYTFTLKEGLKFSDGSALDSEDVKYTYDLIMNPESAASSSSFFASVESIEAPSPTSVVITLKRPDASFLSGLNGVNTGIVPSDVDIETLQTTPIGSGPYKWAKRVANESITLERNDDFFLGTPGVAELEFRIIPESQAMVSALKTEQIDAAIFDNPVTAKTAASNSTKTEEVGSLQYHVLQLRAASPVLADVNKRLAIQCAISRQEVIDSAALGAGEVTGPITAPEFRSDVTAQPCPEQDLDKAKEYLKKAGTPDGFDLNIITSQGLYSTAVDEAQTVQAQLALVGIKVKVETLDSSAYVDKWLAGGFDAAIAANGGGTDPHTGYARYFTSTGSFNNVAGYSSPELDALFAEGIATTDIAERKAIYTELSDYLVDNAVWAWLFTPKKFIVLNAGVNDYEARIDASLAGLWKANISK